MNRSAVDFLKEKLTYVFVNDKSFNELFEQAKAMEKEQICDAFYYGVDVDSFNVKNPYKEAEQYYNETFKSE